jgi:hypothetical protein
MESKQLKFYHGDFVYINAASALTTLFWNPELENSNIDYSNARTNLLECLIFNYREIFKSISIAEEDNVTIGCDNQSQIPTLIENSLPSEKPQTMLTAGIVEATAVELGPVPYTEEIEGYQLLDVTKLDAKPLFSTIPGVSNYDILSIDSTDIYASLDALGNYKEKTTSKTITEKPYAVLDDTTWTSFNTFDLPPLTIPTLKPTLVSPDSQESLFDNILS